jgi:hypothetical protein
MGNAAPTNGWALSADAVSSFVSELKAATRRYTQNLAFAVEKR